MRTVGDKVKMINEDVRSRMWHNENLIVSVKFGSMTPNTALITMISERFHRVDLLMNVLNALSDEVFGGASTR